MKFIRNNAASLEKMVWKTIQGYIVMTSKIQNTFKTIWVADIVQKMEKNTW